ncbi:UNVERIFIED_CONTAM: hypothetical protein Sindi_2542800 [Sesamum indicum]
MWSGEGECENGRELDCRQTTAHPTEGGASGRGVQSPSQLAIAPQVVRYQGSREAVSRFQESEKLDTILTDKANLIYDDAIQRCRCVLRWTLRKNGRIVEEDNGLLDPEVSEGEEEVVEVADG